MVRRRVDVRDHDLDVSGCGLEDSCEGVLSGDKGFKRKAIIIPGRENAATGASSTDEFETVCKVGW